MRFLKVHNKFYENIDLGIAEQRLSQIETDENGSIHESLRYIEEDEVEALIASSTQQEVDPSDNGNGNGNDDENESEDETEYASDTDNEEGEAVAEHEIGPETGGASGEIEESPIIEETLMIPVFDSRQTEEERNITALQRLFPNTRLPLNDPIS